MGKIGLKFAGIWIALKMVVCGSCMSIMSYLLLTFSLIISRWAFSDLLRLIWMSRSLLVSVGCSLSAIGVGGGG